MKKKYRFEFKDELNKVYDMTDEQRRYFYRMNNGMYDCPELGNCGGCYFFPRCKTKITLKNLISITEIEELTEFNSIYELYAWLSVEGNLVRSKSGSSQLFSLEDKFFCIYDTWEKVIQKKEPKTKKVKLLCYLNSVDELVWLKEITMNNIPVSYIRVIGEDKLITIDE